MTQISNGHKKFMVGIKSKRYIDAIVLTMIATLVAKFFRRLSAYFMQTATVRPPMPYHQTTALK